MKMKFFWIPARDSAAAEAELNAFLARSRVVQVEKAFTADTDGPGWSLCVQWLPGENEAAGAPGARGARVDYREVLDAPTFKIFAALRTWRKVRAVADAVPIYTVATNEQLAQAFEQPQMARMTRMKRRSGERAWRRGLSAKGERERRSRFPLIRAIRAICGSNRGAWPYPCREADHETHERHVTSGGIAPGGHGRVATAWWLSRQTPQAPGRARSRRGFFSCSSCLSWSNRMVTA